VIELRKLGRTEQIAGAQLSARAMRGDPLHIAVIGTNPEHRRRQLTRFFATLLRVLQAPPFSLWEGNRLLGVAGRAPPGTQGSAQLFSSWASTRRLSDPLERTERCRKPSSAPITRKGFRPSSAYTATARPIRPECPPTA